MLIARVVGLGVSLGVMWGCAPVGKSSPIEVPADPLKATGTLDGARRVSKTFGWHSGGTLAVTAADGTVYSLQVPETALTDDTTLTITPYASLTTPLGERSYGVQLEPEGLFPTSFLELSITPRGPDLGD